MIDETQLSCLNKEYKFKIDRVLYFLDNKTVKGFEGIILINDKESHMLWEANGRAFSDNRGYDLVIRKDIHEREK